jgi:hypothetical protein
MVVSVSGRYDVESLRREHPIAEVVSRYDIELAPKGRALVGRCPFHADGGRPNLYVYPETRSWYCFRCAIGGDVIDFIRRREHVGFAEACRRLVGSQDTPSSLSSPRRQSFAERRWDQLTLEEQVVMNTERAVYQHSRWREPRALDYLRARGIPDQVIRECALGFADGYSLERHLHNRSGLVTARELGLLAGPRRGEGGGSPREFLAGQIVVPEEHLVEAGATLLGTVERPETPAEIIEPAAAHCGHGRPPERIRQTTDSPAPAIIRTDSHAAA